MKIVKIDKHFKITFLKFFSNNNSVITNKIVKKKGVRPPAI